MVRSSRAGRHDPGTVPDNDDDTGRTTAGSVQAAGEDGDDREGNTSSGQNAAGSALNAGGHAAHVLASRLDGCAASDRAEDHRAPLDEGDA